MFNYVNEQQGLAVDFAYGGAGGLDIVVAQETMDRLQRDGAASTIAQLRMLDEKRAYVPLSVSSPVEMRSSVVADLLTRVESLERQVALLTQRPDLTTSGSFNRHDSLSVKPEEGELDLAVLSAAPLIKKDSGCVQPLPDSSLNFESEKRELVEHFRQKNIGLDVKFEAATLSNLIDLMELNPKVLQIDCHGIYTPNCTKFFLAFENSNEVGVLDMVDAERLKSALMWKRKSEMIVLVNACYSEAIASVFLEAGVPCVIAVHNECKIMDEAARLFEKEFYRELFRGSTVKEAFTRAQMRIEDEHRMDTDACCCAHTHKADCLWRIAAQGNNALKAHALHYSQKCCLPAKRHPCQHHLNCRWAERFLEQFNPDHVIKEEEKQKQQYVVCCCSPELPHDESTKYRLLPKGSAFHDKVIFPVAKNVLELRNSYSRLTPPFLGKLTYGRHEAIFTLMQWLTPKSPERCVTVFGDARIGKTTIVKRASQYCFERHCFPDGVIYVDVTGRTFFDYFFSQMEKELQLGDIKNEKDLRSIIKRFTLLIIIDGIDSILDHDEESAKKVLTYLLENTECPKFVIVSQRRFVLESASHLHVGPLSKQDAAALLYSLAGDQIKERRISLHELEKHKIWDTIGCSPASVQLIAPLLKDTSLDRIVEEHSEKHQKLESKSAALQIIIDTLELNQHAKELFRLLCHFPQGLFRSDLELLCQEFPDWDWDYFLNYLVAEKNNVHRGSWCVKRINNYYEARHDIAEFLESREPLTEYVPAVVRRLAKVARRLVHLASCSDSEQEGRNYLFIFDASLEVGLWAPPQQDKGQISELEKAVDQGVNESDEEVFERHERNFLHYTYRRSLEKMYPDHLPENVIPFVADIMLCLATLYVFHGKDNFYISGYLDQCLNTCEKYGLKRAYNTLKLMRLSLLYADLRQVEKSVDQILMFFTEEGCEEGKAESYMLRALLRYNSTTLKQSSPVLARHNTSDNDFKNDLKLAKSVFTGTMNDLGIARVMLLKSEANSQTATKLNYVDHLKEAAATFGRHNKKTLQIHSVMLQLDFLTRIEAFEMARLAIAEIKALAGEHKTHQRVLNEKTKLLFTHIQRKSRNVFSFFKSFPLVKRKRVGEYTRAGALSRFPSRYREDLLKMLQTCNKVVNIRMDIGTRQNLRQCIESGTRVLHISSEEFSSDSLFLENEDGSADEVTIDDISNQLFSNSLGLDSDSHGIEVVVLAVQSSQRLAEAIHNTLKVPHVVGIEFTDYPLDAEASHTQKLYQEALNVFCLHFYRKLIEGESVRSAFKCGVYFMEDSLHPHSEVLHEHSRGDYDPQLIVVRGGPVLVAPDDPIHDRKLFTTSHIDIFHTEVRLRDGEFQDLSPPRAPTNLQKIDCYTGRQELLFRTIKDLRTRRCVQITGQSGSGRTTFLTYLGYHLCMRHKYSDGIFYVDCSGGKSINERLKDLRLISSVEQLSDLSSKKDLLLLLDDCDALIQSSANQFQSLLFQLVNKYEVTVLFSSVVDLPARDKLDFTRSKLTPLSCDERAAMVLSRDTTLTQDQIDPQRTYPSLVKALADHYLLKKSMGLPKKILEIIKNGFEPAPSNLLTPCEMSRKVSFDFADPDIDDIHKIMSLTRENSTNIEEARASELQDRVEDLTLRRKGKERSKRS